MRIEFLGSNHPRHVSQLMDLTWFPRKKKKIFYQLLISSYIHFQLNPKRNKNRKNLRNKDHTPKLKINIVPNVVKKWNGNSIPHPINSYNYFFSFFFLFFHFFFELRMKNNTGQSTKDFPNITKTCSQS